MSNIKGLDMNILRWLQDVRRDVAYANRVFRRSPGFAAVAVLTLALGIGANTAVFSVVNSVLLRPLPYPGSDRLVRFVEDVPPTAGSNSAVRRPVTLPLSELSSFRGQARSLSHVGVYVPSTMMLTGRGEATRVPTVRLSPAVLSMLGVPPALGRIFESSEEKSGADSVVVLSHRFWQQQFAAAPDAIGKNLTLDGRNFAIVGVMPPGFHFPDPQTQLWIPYALGGSSLRARMAPVARLADGASMAAANAEVGTVLRQLTPTPGSQQSLPPRIELERLQDQLVGRRILKSSSTRGSCRSAIQIRISSSRATAPHPTPSRESARSSSNSIAMPLSTTSRPLSSSCRIH